MVDNYWVHCYRNLLRNPFQICRVLCTSARPRATHGARVQPHRLHEHGEYLLKGLRECGQDIVSGSRGCGFESWVWPLTTSRTSWSSFKTWPRFDKCFRSWACVGEKKKKESHRCEKETKFQVCFFGHRMREKHRNIAPVRQTTCQVRLSWMVSVGYIIRIKRCFPRPNQWLLLHVLAICL